MMELYIANCSKQDFLFTYMLPENIRPFSHKIRAGAQIRLVQTQVEADTIIKQHQPYGLMEVSHVKKGFGGLCYRFGKAISVEAIEAGITEACFDRGRYLYHGRVKSVVDGLREAGLKI